MKKLISILLALLLVAGLAACGAGSDSGTKPADTTPADTTPADTDKQDSAEPAKTDDGGKQDAEPSSEPEKEEEPAASGVMSDEEKDAKLKEIFGDINIYPEYRCLVGNGAGYATDDVDHQARDPYKVAFVFSTSSAASKNIVNGLYKYQDHFNFKLEESYADGDVDKYMTLLETYALDEYDGFILNPDNNVYPRTKELCDELGIPYIFVLSPYKDADGRVMVPAVGENDYNDGLTVINWLLDNYEARWGDVDPADIGVIGLYWSTNIPMNLRVNAAEDVWKEKYPQYADHFFYVDTAAQSNGVSQEAAYNEISTFITAHTGEYKYWLVASAAGLFANGASRAMESLGLDASSLICSIGIEELVNQWNAGYDGCWAGCVAIDSELYGLPMISGLLALMDGRATQESLWSDLKNDGDLSAYYIVDATVMTRDIYLDYLDTCGVVKEYFQK